MGMMMKDGVGGMIKDIGNPLHSSRVAVYPRLNKLGNEHNDHIEQLRGWCEFYGNLANKIACAGIFW